MTINIIRIQDTTTFTKNAGAAVVNYEKETIEVLYTVPAGKRAKVILEEYSGVVDYIELDKLYFIGIVPILSTYTDAFLNSIGLDITSGNTTSSCAVAGLVVGNKTVLTNGKILKGGKVERSTGNLCFKTPDGKHYLTVHDNTTDTGKGFPTYGTIDKSTIGDALYEFNNPGSTASNLVWYKTLVGWLKSGQTTPKEHILTEGETVEYAFLYQYRLHSARLYASANLTIIEEDV